MEITFSIILPVRNGGTYAKECIYSILNQSYKAFDLIILDNNSTDGTTEFIQSLRDNRIIHNRSNKYLSMPENWKRAMTISTNEFITFIGHDDLLYEDYLREMHVLINKFPDASIYQCHFNYINSDGNIVRKSKKMNSTINVAEFLKGEFLQTMDSMGTGFMFRATDFKQIGGFDYTYPNLLFADYKLFVQLTGIYYLAVSPKTCFAYRLHNSLSISTNVDQYRTAFDKYMSFLNKFKKEEAVIQVTLKNYASHFLMYYCRSLSHRLLKSPISNRIKIRDFIKDCKKYAGWFGVLKKFSPYSDPTILSATILDSNILTRKLYRFIRKRYAARKTGK